MEPSLIIDIAIRWYLGFFFTGVALFYTARIIYKKRQTKSEVVFPGNRFTTTWWTHSTFRFFRAAIWLFCVLRIPFPDLDNYLLYFDTLAIPVILVTGAILLTGGFILAIMGHMTLGSNWTSGINPKGPTRLETNGLYQMTRNPMFLGVKIAQIGFFLALPSLFSLVCLIVGWIAIDKQLEQEELYLDQTFRQEYANYCNTVPRWLIKNPGNI